MDHKTLQPNWEYVADTVMGGVSTGSMDYAVVQGRPAVILNGDVSLDNNGGFIQIAFDLQSDGTGLDASGWDGIALDVLGNGETYDVRLRTDDLTRPWQSFRTDITTDQAWQTVKIPFDSVTPHKTEATFDASKLRRIGILAIGAVFTAKIAISRVALYRG